MWRQQGTGKRVTVPRRDLIPELHVRTSLQQCGCGASEIRRSSTRPKANLKTITNQAQHQFPHEAQAQTLWVNTSSHLFGVAAHLAERTAEARRCCKFNFCRPCRANCPSVRGAIPPRSCCIGAAGRLQGVGSGPAIGGYPRLTKRRRCADRKRGEQAGRLRFPFGASGFIVAFGADNSGKQDR